MTVYLSCLLLMASALPPLATAAPARQPTAEEDAGPGDAQQPGAEQPAATGVRPAQQPRPSRLLTKLRDGKPITIVGYGDSITYGQGVANAAAESYLNVWARGLRAFFGDDRVRLVNLSDPGVVSWYAMKFIESHIAPEDPDLVILQFGGNDSREKVPLETFWRSLTQMVLRTRATTQAEVVLVVPPMLHSREDKQMIDAIWRVGRKNQVTVADLNGALQQNEGDHRGLFPLDGHPTAYSHKLMARELHRACAPLLGIETPVSIEALDQTWVVTGNQPASVGASVRNETEVDLEVTVSLALSAPWGATHEGEVAPAPGKSARVDFTPALPEMTEGSTQFRLWTYASAKGGFAFDQKWATFAPLVTCTPADEAAEDQLPTITLGEEHLALGAEEWEGEDDLRVGVWLTTDATSLRIQIRVYDDQLVRDFHDDAFENDCVELFFDTRPEHHQGRLFYSEETFAVFVKPPTPANPEPELIPLSRLPGKAEPMDVGGRVEDDGYSLEVVLPLNAFQSDGEQLARFGFDVAVDDADEPGWRQTQMIWAGLRDNYLNPSCLGVVQLEGKVPPGARRLTVR